ncbi:MAG: hypothetical protein C5B47_02310 [Verrucomicrobia bacterium]|nr:MAG: hypothetical protein C5B47_02310 [Verrucomicrobiota bacterium]
MKVVHIINEIGSGGASRTVIDLHLGLRKSGVESFLLTRWAYGPLQGETVPYSEFYPCEEQGRMMAEAYSILVQIKQPPVSNVFFCLDLFGCDLSGHPLIQGADILHLHCQAGFLSSASIAKLGKLKKPFLWTVHDMHPLTGGCHYLGGCERFAETCGSCPQLQKEPLNFTAQNLNALASAVAVAKPVFVAPSQKMLQVVRKSRVSKQSRSHCISNGVNCDIFRPLEKAACRAQLNLEKDARYILFTSRDLLDQNKGPAAALAILEVLRQYPVTAKAVASGEIRLLCCGGNSGYFNPRGWHVDRFDYISADKMHLIYNSADVLLFTSREEAFGNVVPEAMACGIPVIAHRVGGTVEILGGSELLSNCLFNVGESDAAVAFLIRLLQNKLFYQQLSTQCVERIRQSFSLEKQADSYQELYLNLLAEGSPSNIGTQEVPSFVLPIHEGSRQALLVAVEEMESKLERKRATMERLKDLVHKPHEMGA